MYVQRKQGMAQWRPTTIRRFVKGLPTSACTAIVETDAGLGYLKAMGGPEGDQTLASEVVVTQLAAWFGIPTLQWSVIDIDEVDEIPFFDREQNRIGQAKPGPAFITREDKGITWGGGDRELKMLVNPDDLSRLVVFDTWVLNCDRHSPMNSTSNRRRKPNLSNVFLSDEAPAGQFLLKSIDHTHCFTCGGEWTRRLSRVDIIKDERVFGLFPEFRSFLTAEAVARATSDMVKVSPTVVEAMIKCVPNEWCISSATWTALIDLIIGRAAYLSETMEKRLFPQGTLFPKGEMENLEL